MTHPSNGVLSIPKVNSIEEEFVEASADAEIRSDDINRKLNSELNVCDFCFEMQLYQARMRSAELRLNLSFFWQEFAGFSHPSPGGFAQAEVVTVSPGLGVSYDVYHRVRRELSEQEILDFTFVVMSAEAWAPPHVEIEQYQTSDARALLSQE